MITIATQAGFTSEQSFYRNFKKFTGVTPAQWYEQKTNLK
ncbi:AraC family transcriptional regulator [uncultured Prevotella sp.]|nr:AraC family transcriptional regulator [uncultured Prevotella sp.]